MYLAKMRVKGFSVKFDGHVKQKIPEDKLHKLVHRLASGDDVGNEIIEGHVRLVLQVAGRYVSYYPNKHDDIVGVALLAATECVSRAKSKIREPYNISGWIVTSVHTAIEKHLSRDAVVSRPRNRKKLKTDVRSLEVGDMHLEDTAMAKKIRRERVEDAMGCSHLTEIEILIVKMILDGWRIGEIAGVHGKSKQRVSEIYNLALQKMREMG